MAEAISVSLKGDHSWRTDCSFGVLMELMINIVKKGWRAVQEGVSTRFRLDTASREQDGNPWNTNEKTEDDKYRERAKDIANLRRGNKGLDMELLISSVLTYLDHPADVRCNCHVYKGMPNKAAGGGEPDIVFRPQESAGFQVVCEVSANKSMTDADYRKQLNSALRHAVDEHKKAGVAVTYALLVNLREAGTDKGIHKVFRKFVAENEKTLGLWKAIRFVLIEGAELSTLMKNLYYEDVLACRSDLLAGALDDIHKALMGEKIPTGDDWMAERMYSLILQEEEVPVESLFNVGPRAVE